MPRNLIQVVKDWSWIEEVETGWLILCNIAGKMQNYGFTDASEEDAKRLARKYGQRLRRHAFSSS